MAARCCVKACKFLAILLVAPAVNVSLWTVATTCGWFPTAPDANGHAVVATDRTHDDLGEVTAGANLTAAFPVKNVGRARLILQQVQSSCECLCGDKPEILVDPGAQAQITAHIDTGKLRGPLRLELRYRSNDPARPLLTFILLADVRAPLPRP